MEFPKIPTPPIGVMPETQKISDTQSPSVPMLRRPGEEPASYQILQDDETLQILQSNLTKKHMNDPACLAFIDSYLVCRHVAQACRDAGINRSVGGRLITRPDVYSAINAITAMSAQKFGYDAHQTVERVKEFVEFDPAEFYNPDGTVKENMHDVRPESRRCLKKWESKNLYDTDPNGMPIVIGKLFKFEVWDKIKGSELLGREKSTFKQTSVVQHDLSTDMKDVLLESGRRGEERAEKVMKDVIDTQASVINGDGDSENS